MSLPSVLQQNIYNCYLKHSRAGQPWKVRRDFSNLKEEIKQLLVRLELFFEKFKHISPEDFFGAFQHVYPDENYPQLSWFISRAAIKTYTTFQQRIQDQSPDNQIDKIKEGLKYIACFCLSQDISLEEYLKYKVSGMPIWMEHYRQFKVSPYCLLELGDLNLQTLEEDQLNVWVPGLVNNFSAIKSRYHLSKTAKPLLKKAVIALKKTLSPVLKDAGK